MRAFIDYRAEFPLLKSLTQTVIHWLANETMFETASDVVIEIMTTSFSFFTQDDSTTLANILVSPWAVTRYEQLASGDVDSESIQFGRLLVTFAEATVQKLAQGLDTS